MLSASMSTLTVVVAANVAGTAKLSAATAETANNRALCAQPRRPRSRCCPVSDDADASVVVNLFN